MRTTINTLNNVINTLCEFRDANNCGDKPVFLSNFEQKNVSWNLPSRGTVLEVEKDEFGNANVLLKLGQ